MLDSYCRTKLAYPSWFVNYAIAIVCDLERRRPVILLPDRERATAEAWLADHREIAIVARDRGGGYGEAVARALPHATQVADRWHLMENASRAFLDAVRKSMRQIRSAIGATTINSDLLTCAERIQYEGFLHREETNTAILSLAKEGVPIKQIVRRTGHSRKLVRQVVRGEHNDVFRSRQSSLETHLPWLDAQWNNGSRNAAALWRKIRQLGFGGSARVVARVPSARTIARLMTIGRDSLSKAETVTIAAIEGSLPTLVEAREAIAAFHAMIRRKAEADLTSWIDRARKSLVASFANGVGELNAELIKNLRSAGKRVLITEGRLPSEGLRFDMLEIDFVKGRAELLDIAATPSPLHLEKTHNPIRLPLRNS